MENQTKVYLVIKSIPYEGYCCPEGVFATLEAAEARAAIIRKGLWSGDDVEVFEYEVET